jgi:polysaccharide export outer membrane protein
MNIRLSVLEGLVAGLLLLTAPAGAVSQPAAPAQPAQPSAAQSPSADQNYVLGPADVIEADVVGASDFKARVKIAADGTVQVPYLGRVVAANKTTQQLSDDLSRALEVGGYYSHPVLSVDVVEYASQHVTVLGDVGTPGVIAIDRPYHLSEILARVGGVREGGADYVIITSENGSQRTIPIKALATGDTSQDPLVTSGDKIFSPAAELFYISGQVKTPGAFPILSGMTLRMAISRGGGLTDLGTDRAVKVTRGGKTLAETDLDSPVEPGDVIVVGERLF